ncbi:MAG TPA: RNA 2',3'-cyclic phosphodiesterase [Actinobacteria bacterium]|nr:RNA 2',3'-cyclic phosphodiesterase [Actinomycetota bacterium]
MKEGAGDTGGWYRLFMAIDIPDDAVAGLVAWQQRFLAGDRALRLTPAAQLHITLVFLGQMGEEQLEQVADQLDRLEDRSACELAASRMVGLPRGRNPRVIAAAFDGPAEGPRRIYDELAAGLVAKGLGGKEKRNYFPHVTLARSRGRTRISPGRITPEPVKFTAVRVTLYNSILKPSGAEHRPLKSVQLT